MKKAIIEVINLTKDYGSNRGVFDISFSIEKGEVFGFLGPNGAGKSTTIRHLMGFSKPDNGETKIFSLNTFNEYSKILKKVGYIPGELALPAGLTGYEHIKMMQSLIGIKNDERLKMLCDIFKMNDQTLKMNTKQLSLGSKRKLAIITAFMSDPEVLILDEPTSGLDPLMQDVFIDFIIKEKVRGKTILLSSHLFNEVEKTCDRISIIKDGRIITTFMVDDFKHNKNKKYLIKFKTKKAFNEFKKSNKINEKIKIIEENSNKEILIEINDDYIKDLIEYLSNFILEEFSNITESLQDYFLKFYENSHDFGGI